jgi:hypothetical protein
MKGPILKISYLTRLREIVNEFFTLDTGSRFTKLFEELDILVNHLVEGADINDMFATTPNPGMLFAPKYDMKTTINIAVKVVSDMYPEEKNELAAIRRYRAQLHQTILFNERMHIDASHDRDLYDFLYVAEQELLKNNGWLPGSVLGGHVAPQL